MEKNQDNYEKYLWNKFEDMTKRVEDKFNNCNIVLSFIDEISNETKRFSNQVDYIGQKKFKKASKIDNIIKAFKNSFRGNIKINQDFLDKARIVVAKYFEELKKAKNNLNEFLKISNTYHNNIKKYTQAKEAFHRSCLELETKIHESVKKKHDNNLLSEQIEIPKKNKKDLENFFKKYNTSLEEINQKLFDFIKEQKNFIQVYANLIKIELEEYKELTGDFMKLRDETIKIWYEDDVSHLCHIYSEKDISNKLIEELKKLQLNPNPDKEKDGDFKFENFLSKLDFDKCETPKEFKILQETVEIIKNTSGINKIYENINIEKEVLKKELRDHLKNFFLLDSSNSNISNEQQNLYFELLKDTEIHKTFLKTLNKFRTNNKLSRNKQLIELLGKSFRIVIDDAEKNTNFYEARNCIILSETYYFEEKIGDTKTNIYAADYLKHDTWLAKKEFWHNLTFWMVEEELKKFSNTFPEVTMKKIQKNEKFPNNQMNIKICDIIFSQILLSVMNIRKLKESDEEASELIQICKEKYKYLTEETINRLYNNISTDKKYIEELKNEYNKKKLEKQNLIIEKSNENEIKEQEEDKNKIIKMDDNSNNQENKIEGQNMDNKFEEEKNNEKVNGNENKDEKNKEDVKIEKEEKNEKIIEKEEIKEKEKDIKMEVENEENKQKYNSNEENKKDEKNEEEHKKENDKNEEDKNEESKEENKNEINKIIEKKELEKNNENKKEEEEKVDRKIDNNQNKEMNDDNK